MVNQNVVKRITDYLDESNAKSTSATLVGIFWYVDSRDRTPPLLEEINQALASRSNVGMENSGVDVIFVFGHQKANPGVTQNDFQRADAAYRKEFSLKLKELKNRKSGDAICHEK